MTTLKWGVIGCGQIALDKTIPAILKATNSELAAVSDMSRDRLGLVRQTVEDVKTYSDPGDLLTSAAIDAVYVALPNKLHCPITLEAARHRKHVLCEKPLALDAGEARRMINACRDSDVKLMTAYMARFGDVFREAQRALASGCLGRITMINANFSYAAHRSYPPGKLGFWRWTGEGGGGGFGGGGFVGSNTDGACEVIAPCASPTRTAASGVAIVSQAEVKSRV